MIDQAKAIWVASFRKLPAEITQIGYNIMTGPEYAEFKVGNLELISIFQTSGIWRVTYISKKPSSANGFGLNHTDYSESKIDAGLNLRTANAMTFLRENLRKLQMLHII